MAIMGPSPRAANSSRVLSIANSNLMQTTDDAMTLGL
jgi:hypothetical protein